MARGESLTQSRSAHTLVVVDDERTLRFSIGEWARDEGFQPLEAADGQEALDLVRESSVDVVVLDLKLSNEDGMEVLKRLREEEPALPVIVLTGHGTIEQAVQATRLRAFHFMLNPP